MSILKYTMKYLMIGGYALLVIFAIGSLIFSQRQEKETEAVVSSDSTVVRYALTPRARQSTGVGHIHADGTRHTDSPIFAYVYPGSGSVYELSYTVYVSRPVVVFSPSFSVGSSSYSAGSTLYGIVTFSSSDPIYGLHLFVKTPYIFRIDRRKIDNLLDQAGI